MNRRILYAAFCRKPSWTTAVYVIAAVNVATAAPRTLFVAHYEIIRNG
jgi:hypothetical protein